MSLVDPLLKVSILCSEGFWSASHLSPRVRHFNAVQVDHIGTLNEGFEKRMVVKYFIPSFSWFLKIPELLECCSLLTEGTKQTPALHLVVFVVLAVSKLPSFRNPLFSTSITKSRTPKKFQIKESKHNPVLVAKPNLCFDPKPHRSLQEAVGNGKQKEAIECSVCTFVNTCTDKKNC